MVSEADDNRLKRIDHAVTLSNESAKATGKYASKSIVCSDSQRDDFIEIFYASQEIAMVAT